VWNHLLLVHLFLEVAEAEAEVESNPLPQSLWEMAEMVVAEMEELGRITPMQQDAQQKEQPILEAEAEVVQEPQ
jgi:thymidine phosphorylase